MINIYWWLFPRDGRAGWYVTTCGMQAVFSWFCLMINTPPLEYFIIKYFFRSADINKEIIFLRTNPSEVKHLAVGDGGLAMLEMATVHMEGLMCVRGFDVQVSLNSSVLEVNPCVQRTDLF